MPGKRSRFHQSSVEGFAFLVLSVALGLYSLVMHENSQAKWKMSAYLFPLVIAFFLFLLSISLILEGTKEMQQQAFLDTHSTDLGTGGDAPGQASLYSGQGIRMLFASLMQRAWKDSLLFALICLLYILLIAPLGFVVATVLFLALSFYYLKERRVALIGVLSLSFPVVVYLLFGMLLHVMLP